MTQIPIFQMGAGSAIGQLTGQGQSTSTPTFMMPDFGKIGQGFQGLQGGVRSNQLQDRAVREQMSLRNRIGGLITQSGEGQRGRINEAFQTASRNVAGGLQRRGFAGSSLNLPGQLGVERERTGAIGDLEDRLLSQRISADTGITGSISDLLFGSSEQATNLLGGILGSGGIGNISQATTSRPGGGGGGGSGSSGGLTGADAYESFQDWAGQFGGGGTPPSGSGGGGGSGSAGGFEGGEPFSISNPFFRDDEEEEEDLANAELLTDLGPLQTPDAFAKNQQILNAREAKNQALMQSLFGGQGTEGDIMSVA